MAFPVRRHHNNLILVKKVLLCLQQDIFLCVRCHLFTLGELPARLVSFGFVFFFFHNTKVFYLYFNLSPSFVNIWSYLKELQSRVGRKQTRPLERKHQLFNHLGQKTLGDVWNRNGRKTLSSRQHCVVA